MERENFGPYENELCFLNMLNSARVLLGSSDLLEKYENYSIMWPLAVIVSVGLITT